MWEVFSESRCTEDNVEYTAFGVRTQNCCVADICTREGEITQFAEMLNRCSVSEVHIYDIIEDYLAG